MLPRCYRRRVLALIVAATVVFASSGTVGRANEVRSIKWYPRDDVLRFEVTLAEATGFGVTDTIAQDGALRFRIANVNQPFKNQTLLIGDDRIKQCSLSFDETKKSLTFTFYPSAGVTARQSSQSKPVPQVLIDFAAAPPATHALTKPDQQSPAVRASGAKRVVIIDPGHGGATRGAFTRKKIAGRQIVEKDVVLDIARMLKKMVDETPTLTARLTREGDETMSLRARCEFAVKNEGDLFVSIHCNSTPWNRASSACGIEFYYWNEKGSDDAAVRWLEEQENTDEIEAAINNHSTLKGLLVNLLKDQLEAQAALSEQLCASLQKSFVRHPYFAAHCRGIKSARFKVLENYAMPSVLVEVGFLSNAREAKMLAEPQFQRQAAALLLEGIKAHFAENGDL